jgi:hypothetical protein
MLSVCILLLTVFACEGHSSYFVVDGRRAPPLTLEEIDRISASVENRITSLGMVPDPDLERIRKDSEQNPEI